MSETTTTETTTTETTTAADKAVADSQQATETTDTTTTETTTVEETKYDLKLPDGSTADPGLLERTAAIARARGLTNEQAQAVVDHAIQEASTQAKAAADAAIQAYQPGGAEWQKQSAAWKAETLADPALGATEAERIAALRHGERVIEKFAEAHPEDGKAIKAFLESTALGNKREVARFIAWLGKTTEEGTYVQAGKPGDGKASPEQRWYPELAEKAKS